MGWVQAAMWGLSGGLAAGVLSLITAVAAAGYRWPWTRGELGPRLFVVAGGLLLGALVAAAAHGQMSGGWPAFVMGAGAPATVRGLLSGVEASTRPAIPAPSPPRVPPPLAEEPMAARKKGDVSETAG
jgi:hypothetical protein